MALAPSAPELPADARSPLTPAAWDRLTRAINLYSWAQVAFLSILIGSLHAVPLLGKRWSSCVVHATGATDWWRVLFYHLYEIPLAVLFIYHAHYGFKKVTRGTLPYYTFLTLFQVIVLFVFVTFESKTLLDAMAQSAESWEILVIFGGCTGMLVDSILGFYVAFAHVLPAYLSTLPARES
jgi:hypothetical protein